MTLSKSSRKTLITLRKKDLAEALKNLSRGEEDLKKIDADLLTLRTHIASIQNRLEKREKREITALHLEEEMILNDRLSKEKRDLLGRAEALGLHKNQVALILNDLKDAVVMAKRALSAIEKNES